MCEAQRTIELKYLGMHYSGTRNKTFINRQLIFLNGGDTLQMNQKIPYDTTNHQVLYYGVYQKCHLKNDSTYTITLTKICLDSITDVLHSYYKINAIADKNDCSKFTEIERTSEYRYEVDYGKYVDIQKVLYEITRLTPNTDCFPP